MKRACVFCGEKPDKKNNEHIVPQWLIKMTGEPKRKVVFGLDYQKLYDEGNVTHREFSFDSFKFPACESCNSKFGQLEEQAKEIFLMLFNNAALYPSEISLLLDWFDKLRVGVWLAYNYLNKGIHINKPNFYISKRIAQKDRTLAILQIKDNPTGLTMIGNDLPLFYYNPSCFALKVNKLLFINTSHDFIISKNLGFPFAEKPILLPGTNKFQADFSPGTEKISQPIQNLYHINDGIEIFQPIVPIIEFVNERNNSIYKTDYIKSNCLSYENGLGKVFVKRNNKIIKLDNRQKINIIPREKISTQRVFRKIIPIIFDTQITLYSKYTSGKVQNKEESLINENIKQLIDLQEKLKELVLFN